MALLLADRTLVVARDEWGARRPRATASTSPSEGLIDHWLGDGIWTPATIEQHERCPAALRAVQNFHMDARGWSDIAYNYAVCPHGVAFELRGFNRNGANGVAYWNRTTFTVLWLLGAGDPFDSKILGRMATAVRDVMDWLVVVAHADPRRRGHRDIRQTACPGPEIHKISVTDWTPQPYPVRPAPLPDVPAPPVRRPRDETAMYALRDTTTNDVWRITPGEGPGGRARVSKLKDPFTFFRTDPDRSHHQVALFESPTMRWAVWEDFFDSAEQLRPDVTGVPSAPF
jgi:hypothetical protein